ncbi:hypothetical protein LTR70_000163 [Exophiala xenobiotica]|uniref:DUF202 domain-containing protein n=1 Tax=Lithohypha guttulata TaxID=1690604 RepID=A0ABR0KQD9_9EURO|nr:hypothetical protein LTR24_000288 [Lithohypha guttulata]KAK5330841.1 hypothetical protein LTR70_000163 [Exophiala xenobiotica]
MDNQAEVRSHGSTTSRLSSSRASSGERRDDPEPDTQHSSITPKRSSSVRFQDDMVGGLSSTPRRRTSADTDEITPIRQADGQANRKYATTEQDQAGGSNKSRKPPKPAENAPSLDEGRPGVLRRIADKYGSVTLDNKGSVARDHLALERTFLAWLRTSLAFASIGIAITQLFRLNVSLNNKTRRSVPYPDAQSSLLPLSPLLGHGLPPELVPLLQQLVQSAAQSLPTPAPGNTLLDQLLLAPSINDFNQPVVHEQAVDERAAAKLRHVGKPLGATFIGISMVVLLTGFHRYFEAQYWIMRGKFPASRGSVALIGLIAGALIVASLVVVLVIAPVSYEK